MKMVESLAKEKKITLMQGQDFLDRFVSGCFE
jgi:hypothetical protein